MPTTGFDIFQGFSERANQDRKLVQEQQQRREQQELSILGTLSQSDNPEIASQAWAGLLNFADPRAKRKGLAGYIGETEGHPALKGIAALLRPSTTDFSLNTQNGGLPAQPPAQAPGAGGEIRTPPGAAGAGAAAQSATSPVQGGAMGTPAVSANPSVAAPSHATAPPPPAPTSTAQVPGPPVQSGGLAAGPPPSAPAVSVRNRQPFLSPEERHLRNTKAKAQGDVEGEVAGLISAGFTDVEARALIKEKYERQTRGGAGASGNQSIAGEVPDEKGGWMPAFAAFDRVQGVYIDPNTRQPVQGFRPRTTTGSTSLGTTFEQAAQALGYDRGADVPPGEETKRVIAHARTITEGTRYAASTGTTMGAGNAAANIPLSTDDRFTQITTQNLAWRKASEAARDIAMSHAKMQTAIATVDRAIASGQDLASVVPAAAETIIVTFERALDPNSVVREAEARRPGTFSSLLTRLQGAKDRLFGPGGATIPVDELRGYVSLANELATTVSVLQIAERDRITQVLQSGGIDPNLVFGQDPIGVREGAAAPASGGPPQARGSNPPPTAGPGPDWTMVNGVLHYKGKPY